MRLQLESADLVLRPFRPDDAESLYQLCCQPEIINMLPDWQMGRDEVTGFINFLCRQYDNPNPSVGPVIFAVIRKQDGLLAGWCGVGPKEELGGEVEIGYAISSEWWSRGYASQAVGLTLDWARAEMGMQELFALALPYNIASNRVLEKAGFRLLGEKEMEHGGKQERFFYYRARL